MAGLLMTINAHDPFLVGVEQVASPDRQQWCVALGAGVEALEFYGGAREGYRTMLDAWIPALEGLRAGGVAGMAQGARHGADATKSMEAKAGRANYVPLERMQGEPDPGAEAVALALEALAQVLK
jgi:dihydroxyacetone kinase